MNQTQENSQFTITHQSKHKINIIVPSLFQNNERAYILRTLLLKRKAVERIEIVSEKNAVTIHFDPEQLSKVKLLNLLEIVLANFSKKPRDCEKKVVGLEQQRNGTPQNVAFGVGGMSCTSCALFLEMILSRNVNNVHVNIDYVTEIGTVCGYLNKAEVFKIVTDNGFQAYSIDTLAEHKLLLDCEQRFLLIEKK
jgi:Cu+-exporting ATPase